VNAIKQDGSECPTSKQKAAGDSDLMHVNGCRVNVGQTEVECFHMTSPTKNNSPSPPPGPRGDGGNARVDTFASSQSHAAVKWSVTDRVAIVGEEDDNDDAEDIEPASQAESRISGRTWDHSSLNQPFLGLCREKQRLHANELECQTLNLLLIQVI